MSEESEIEIEVDLDYGDASRRGSAPRCLDPAELAADVMIERALATLGLREAVVAPGVTVIVYTPTADWVDEIAESWRETVRGGKDPLADRPHREPDRLVDWREFRRNGDDGAPGPDNGNDKVHRALWQGLSILGVCPVTKALLPRDLVKAADHVITLAEPDVDLVLGVVTRLIGDGPAPAVPAAAWSSLSPLELRLARRVGQSADDYISRLVKLLEPLASGPEPVAQAATMTLDDLHGMDEAVEWGRSLAVELAAYAAGELTWSELDRGALLHGPTGTGKTTLAKCIAASCKVPLTVTSYAAWQSFKDGHLGNVVKAMHNAFDEARKVRPSILFIDELDTIGSRADVGYRDDWWRTIINALLEQLDGSADRDGVIVIAATNFPDVIDPAIKRAGRLDREILVPMPDAAALSAIFRLKLGGDLQGVDLKAAGLAAEGSTGADVEKWLRGARRKARQEKRLILLTDVMEEIRGPKDLRSSEFIRRVAIHEAGHAVFSSVHRPGTLVRITVRKTVGSLGAVLEERAILEAMTLEEIEITMRMLLAGRAAEQVILGSVSGGSGGAEQSDLALATIIAMGAHCGYGLGPTLQWHGPPTFAGVPMMMAATPGLAARVEEMLQASYAEAVAFIRQRQVQVEALGDALVEAETLTGAEADAILEQSYLDTPRHRGGS